MRIRLVTLALILFAVSADAFIPPAPFSLARMTLGREKVRFVTVTHYVGLIRGDQEDLGALQETVTFQPFSESASSSAGWKSDDLGALPGWTLLLSKDSNRLDAGLRALGFDLRTATKHLKRWEGRVCWVYRSPGGQAEVWIEKDSFLPLRFRMGISGDLAAREIQYLQLKTFGDGFTYPQEVLYLKGGLARLRIKLIDLTVNKPLAAALPPVAMTEKALEVLQEMAGVFR